MHLRTESAEEILAAATPDQPGVSRVELLFLDSEARGTAGRVAARALRRAVSSPTRPGQISPA